MAIDTSRDPDFTYNFLERWDVDGHEVAIATMVRSDGTSNGNKLEPFLLCECDFRKDKTDPIVIGEPGDPHSCPAKYFVREKVKQETRDKYGKLWRKLGIKEATLDIYKRVTAGEYLGESWVGLIYVQEVASLLCVKDEQVWKACSQLYGEEKLELNGAILCEFTPRFRFPLEMEGLIAYTVEVPLGWPNGDAGMFATAEIEAEIAQRTGVKNGREAFGNQFPHIELKILVPAMRWISVALEHSAKTKHWREELRALSAKEMREYFPDLEEHYPDIKVEFYAEFVRALVQIVLKNCEYFGGKKEKGKARALRGEAKFFANWAKRHSQNPVT